jgi:anti-sigma regulatory factor (Ser/Thr protein kinase)
MQRGTSLTDPGAVPAKSRTARGHATRDRFCHEALIYGDDYEFVAAAHPFVADALARAEPVLVAISAERARSLKGSLGGDAWEAHFADMEALGRNPARLIPAWRRFLSENAQDGRSVRILSEAAWPGRSPAELSECGRYELLLELAFAEGQAWRLLCAYDGRAVPEEVIESARAAHPFIREGAASTLNDAHLGELLPRPFDGVLPEPSRTAEELRFTRDSLSELREFVARSASAAQLGNERGENLQLAVNELATNSVTHGGGEGRLRVWTEPGSLVCEVSDRGHIEEPLVGRVRPATDQPSGRGLWLVNHLCDLVQIRSAPQGTVVRVYMLAGE